MNAATRIGWTSLLGLTLLAVACGSPGPSRPLLNERQDAVEMDPDAAPGGTSDGLPKGNEDRPAGLQPDGGDDGAADSGPGCELGTVSNCGRCGQACPAPTEGQGLAECRAGTCR